MTRVAKICLGIVSIWPLIYFGVMMLFLAYVFVSIIISSPQPALHVWTSIFLPFHTGTFVLCVSLFVFYVSAVAKAKQHDSERKLIWLLLMFFAGPLAWPTYWYMHIWKSRDSIVKCQQR